LSYRRLFAGNSATGLFTIGRSADHGLSQLCVLRPCATVSVCGALDEEMRDAPASHDACTCYRYCGMRLAGQPIDFDCEELRHDGFNLFSGMTSANAYTGLSCAQLARGSTGSAPHPMAASMQMVWLKQYLLDATLRRSMVPHTPSGLRGTAPRPCLRLGCRAERPLW
jgi:hypothetical protein